jgi:hypothetical protein
LEPSREPGSRRILFAAAALAAVFLLTRAGALPPAPQPLSAPVSDFSGRRALEILSRLLGNGVPHPIGTPADDGVRSQILQILTSLGYDPQVQTAFDCGDYGDCATVNNVLARLPGAESGPAVLLAAHYDSVAAGPGAFDDGAGVATILEIARALKSLPAPRHSIILLLDEGEEPGLLGARAFVDQHPWARDVRAAVNVDARGTSGPSLMFETGAANEWVVRLFARAVRRPASNSILYAAYKQLPNDTDFTIFKAAGYEGLNFAIIGDPVRYHTPLDNLENASAASLQHQGDNTLASVLALANSDLSNPPRREAVYFDLFQRRIILWPASSTLSMAGIAAFLLLVQIAWMIWRKRIGLQECLWGILEWLVIAVVSALLALILAQLLLRAGALPVNWVAHQLPLLSAFWWLAITVVVTHGMLFARRSSYWGSWTGISIWWAILSILIAWQTPALSYVFVLPALVAGLSALPFTFRSSEAPAGFWLAAALPLTAQAILVFPLVLQLYTALGNRSLVPIALSLSIVLMPLAPLCRDLRKAGGLVRLVVPLAPILVTLLSAFAAMVMPAYSAKSPEHSNMDYWMDADSGKSEWLVRTESGRLEDSLRSATQFRRLEPGPFPWSAGITFAANAPRVDLPAPTFTILESSESAGQRTFRALLRSERGALEAMILFPPDSGVDSVRINDLPLEPEIPAVRRYSNGWTLYESFTTPAKGVEIRFNLPVGKPVEIYVLDRSSGLPPEGLFLLKARPLNATPFSDGDLTIVSRRVQLIP